MKNKHTLQSTSIFPGAVLFILLLPCFASALEEHENIKGLFNSTRDVTIKCLECHMSEAEEVLQSTHWTWKRARTVNGQTTTFGKKDSLAGFAIDISTNPSRCLRCHISNSPMDNNFDRGETASVDCLVCHDTTGKYTRNSEKNILAQNDFEIIARNVGKPEPGNCITCHFADCGLSVPSEQGKEASKRLHPSLGDIHMNGPVGSLRCQTCHINSSGHSFPRSMTHTTGISSFKQGCSSCHGHTPHTIDQLNQHTTVISCRTCHIPEYARTKPVIISWNWILIGKVDPLFQSTESGTILARDKNGFSAGTKLQPVYLWDDGSDQIYSRGQRIRPQELTYLQRPSERSTKSKISPFRVLYGTQLYDTKYRYLISPMLSPQGDDLFPSTDWDTIAREGMKALVVPYSGQYGAAPTAIYRRINHGVMPAEDALGCLDCHASNGRIDWEILGYDQDPWTGNQATTNEREHLREEQDLQVQEILPPVQETVIPSAARLFDLFSP